MYVWAVLGILFRCRKVSKTLVQSVCLTYSVPCVAFWLNLPFFLVHIFAVPLISIFTNLQWLFLGGSEADTIFDHWCKVIAQFQSKLWIVGWIYTLRSHLDVFYSWMFDPTADTEPIHFDRRQGNSSLRTLGEIRASPGCWRTQRLSRFRIYWRHLSPSRFQSAGQTSFPWAS